MIRIVFENDDLVVIDKPSGMVVNDSQTIHEETVQSWFEKIYNLKFEIFKNSEFGQKGGVVHRLDRDTSGLLVLAKNERAYEFLKLQFLERRVKKKYIALVHGVMKPESGVVSLPIVRHLKIWGKFTVGDDLSKTAITEWKTLKQYLQLNANYSLLELSPHTGRTHQLRVHMKHLGFPIVADPIYSGRKLFQSDLAWCPRLFLHAGEIEFCLPDTGQMWQGQAPLPEDLDKALQKLVH